MTLDVAVILHANRITFTLNSAAAGSDARTANKSGPYLLHRIAIKCTIPSENYTHIFVARVERRRIASSRLIGTTAATCNRYFRVFLEIDRPYEVRIRVF